MMRFHLFFIFGLLGIMPLKSLNIYYKPVPFFEESTKGVADTCIIEGLIFEMIDYQAPNPLNAKVRNGRIRIFNLQGEEQNVRVIRYVFSVKDDYGVSSVRHYGDLVSYPVLQILKDARIDETFYFEEIIIVDQTKEILNNAVRPIVIKRIAN